MEQASRIAAALPSRGASAAESWFAWTIFPLVFFGPISLAIALIARGTSPSEALGIGLIVGYALVVVGERMFPHVPAWNRSHGDLRTDVAWAATVAATSPLFGAVAGLLALWLAESLSPFVSLALWPKEWPLLFQLGLALVLVEFFQYWIHRLQHETDILWRFHATHHSAPRLYFLNAARFHFVDIGLNGFFFALPLAILGAGPAVVALWVLASTLHGISQHANMKIRCGPLNWIFSMAELHRWHHSRLVEESNTNYGQTLILWDIVFGTRFLPEDREPPADIGIANLDAFPTTFWAQLVSPLRWAEIVRESRRASPASSSRATSPAAT